MDLQSHGTESDNAWKRLAQHPYDRAVILNAGIKVSAIATNTLFLSINYWRFTVSGSGMGRAGICTAGRKSGASAGTEWGETQRFYHHLDAHWRRGVAR